ncbi:Hypothetical protein NTJ_00066 [Nesidiocoris tenuis]|uniref:Uncharacterized protein n=1 Tax=Nesidiocoris tenuis TaxID=355587 RepID=A0ABN7A514_9HEMI|nr:Hypothetical protein NTJ_00066 [Nesidiocoris tenuis]
MKYVASTTPNSDILVLEGPGNFAKSICIRPYVKSLDAVQPPRLLTNCGVLRHQCFPQRFCLPCPSRRINTHTCRRQFTYTSLYMLHGPLERGYRLRENAVWC